MPAVSKKQKKFMGAELGRKKAGRKTRTGMSKGQLEDYVGGPVSPKERDLPTLK
jgi:hypothetical protein